MWYGGGRGAAGQYECGMGVIGVVLVSSGGKTVRGRWGGGGGRGAGKID